jgi:hypothetical protein
VLAHKGGRGQSFEYELLFDGKAAGSAPQLVGLIDVTMLDSAGSMHTTPTLGGEKPGLGGEKAEFGGPYRAHTGALPVHTGPAKTAATTCNDSRINHHEAARSKNAVQGAEISAPSYIPIEA